MSGLESNSRQSATRRFSPPERPRRVRPMAEAARRRPRSRAAARARRRLGRTESLRVRLFGRERVEIGFGIAVLLVDGLELSARVDEFAQRFLDRFADGLFRIELRLLLQVSDRQLGERFGLALDLRIDAGHDAQQRRFARTVEAEDSDLRTGQKAEGDVLENLALRRDDLADAVHGVNGVAHRGSLTSRTGPLTPRAPHKGNGDPTSWRSSKWLSRCTPSPICRVR